MGWEGEQDVNNKLGAMWLSSVLIQSSTIICTQTASKSDIIYLTQVNLSQTKTHQDFVVD